jgi:PAS domain S-box-containing protein
VIGNLCLLDRRPILDEARATAILGPFAARAAAELDRIQTERTLESQRAFLRLVLDINPSLIFAKDREGRFTLVNQAVAEVYGTTVDALIGKTDADFNTNPEEVAFFRKMDLAVMNTGTDLRIPEEPLTDARGRVRWVQTIKRPMVGPDGRTLHVLGVATDITELKRVREDLLEREEREREKVEAELERAKSELVRTTRLAAIGQVAASIAHELRNPLGSITNAAFFLSRRERGLDPKWADHLDIIVQEAQRSDQIIGNLLEMSRPKVAVKERVDLGAVLAETFGRLHGAERTVLEVELDPDPFIVEADAGQMRQVLANLLTNAVQAMDGEGRVRVRAVADTAHHVVTVADDGPGIPPEQRDSVFEPLFTTKTKGTGLGLFICRQILEGHGGSIRAVDADRGAAFEFRLPRSA